MDIFLPYKITIIILGFTGLMMLIQIIIADIFAIKAKHTPGYPVNPDHSDFLFRATRVHSNTNETVAILILFALFGIFSGANALYLNGFSIVYLAGRVGHMVFYYGNVSLARSISFPVSLIGLIGMFITALMMWV